MNYLKYQYMRKQNKEKFVKRKKLGFQTYVLNIDLDYRPL